MVVVFAFTFRICHNFVEDGRYWGSVHSVPSSVPLVEDLFFVCGIWAGSEGFFALVTGLKFVAVTDTTDIQLL